MNSKYGRPSVRITDDVEEKGVAGITAFISTHNLDNTTPCITIQISPHNAGVGTMKEYHMRWTELRKFCLRRGDYQSATILDRERCPSNPFPVKPGTLIEYLDFKCGSTDTRLTVYNSTDLAYDINGDPIYCQDTWHSPVTIHKFRSSISVLHQAYDILRDGYKDVCRQCVLANASTSTNLEGKPVASRFYGSCDVHANNPQLRPVGNAATDRDFNRSFQSKLVWALAYERKGSVQFLPGDVRTLRAHLVHTGGIRNTQVYVMILVGIKLFLHADELIHLKVEDFDPKYQCLNKHGVTSIAVKIKGKSDKAVVYLNLYSDEHHPEFCALRHLLVYMAYTGISGGYLFPKRSVLASCTSTNPKCIANGEQWDYVDWLAEMKHLHRDILEKTSLGGALGTHTLRKTAYLFAVWGVYKYLGLSCIRDGEQPVPALCLANILKSARHKSVSNADTYQSDSVSLLHMVEKERDAEQHAVSPWQSIAFSSLQTAQTIFTPSRIWQKPLPELSVFYVTQVLNMPTTDVQILQLVTAAMRTKNSGNTKKEFLKLISTSCTADVAEQLKELFSKTIQHEVEMCTQRMQSVHQRAMDELRSSITVTNTTDSAGTLLAEISTSTQPSEGDTATVVASTPCRSVLTAQMVSPDGHVGTGDDYTDGAVPNKRTKVARTSIGERTKYKDARTALEKVTILVELRAKYANGLLGITNADRIWYQKYVVRVSKCVESCYGGSVAQFVEAKWLGTFKPYEYKCPLCVGDPAQLPVE